jgi:histidine phosphotransferase ChpT
MRPALDMRVVELLAARLCHELVSPVAAINNGVELLGEEEADFVRDAVDLIGQSARRAGKRLQFYRFAYGTPGSSGPDPKDLVIGLMEGGKIACDWSAEAQTLPRDWQKLACNMVVLAAEALPRGGTVTVRTMRGGVSGIEVEAAGESVNVTPELRAAIAAETAIDDLTSRTVHGYFTARLAQSTGASLTIDTVTATEALFCATVPPTG